MNSKNSTTRLPYTGTELDLVISIDVGTTFSGTSWTLLDPNQVPQIWDVSDFTYQEHHAMKVPSVLYYDRESGELQAAGDSTLDADIIVDAEEKNWIRVEWFKFLLRPENLDLDLSEAPNVELPPKKTVVHVLGDFLKYMAGLSQTHFRERMVGSRDIWEQVKNRIQYVLSHPNRWDTFQHELVRKAAVLGRLIPDSDEGFGRVHFVSEGEASFHYCVNESLDRNKIQVGNNYVVVDAGGGTIDVSSFTVTDLKPLKLKEKFAPDCKLVGSVFVTQAFRRFVERKLATSAYGDSSTIAQMVKEFDTNVKCNFRRSDKKYLVTFGGSNDTETKFDIKAGRLMIQGHEMAEFFEPSCKAAASAVKSQVARNGKTTVLLVGGFAANHYLFQQLQLRLSSLNIELLRSGNATAKAAANGALGFFLDHFISARMARWTYGVTCVRPFNKSDPKHKDRESRIKTNSISGLQYLDDGFQVHLEKGTVVQETELTRFFFRKAFSEKKSVTLEESLHCYHGEKQGIEFMDEDKTELFRDLCSFKAEVPETCLVRRQKGKGSWIASWFVTPEYYWDCDFEIVVSFGTAEFKCYIEWKDSNGSIKRGPATPIWYE